MLKKLNQYLLTHYPLLWNTRIVQVLLVNAIIHLLFFLGGWISVGAHNLQEKDYYFYRGSLTAFSVLCSIVVLIGWLIFYLRNNAFKSFYQLGKWHLTKEFALILLIVFSSITFLESYGYGERTKARRITNYTQLVQEVNTVNLAKAFIPTDKSDYFILNHCGSGFDEKVAYVRAVDYEDTLNNNRNDTNFIKIRNAMRRADAFSYLHYCQTWANLDDTLSYRRNNQITNTVKDWIVNKRKDSITASINQAIAICKKYGIGTELDAAALAALPFADSNHTISRLVRINDYDGDLNASPYYLDEYALNRTFDYLDRCSTHSKTVGHWARLLFELYFMLGIGILLLCYRRFSKKVFLISIIGAGVWCIVLGMVAAGTRSETGLGILYLFLFGLFTAIALAALYAQRNKMVAGVLLNWHIYMIPTVLMAIAFLIVYNYNHAPHLYGVYDSARHCMDYPIGCWVENNFEIIAWGNLVFSLLYTGFIFNRLAKKWHIMPDE